MKLFTKYFKICFHIVLLNLFFVKGQYSTPDNNVIWTLDSIALHSPSTVSLSGENIYTLHSNLNISETDSLVLNKNLRLEILPNVEIRIRGGFYCNSESIVITAQNQNLPYMGVRIEESAYVYLNNTLIEYGGGLSIHSENLQIENCELSNNNNPYGSTTNAVMYFYKNGVVSNCIFKNNFHPAISSENEVTLVIENSYFEGNNKKNDERPQIHLKNADENPHIVNNNIIMGDRSLRYVGGIAKSNSLGPGSSKTIISNNTVKDNSYGIRIHSGGDVQILNNILEDNTTGDYAGGGSGSGIWLSNGSNPTIIIRNNQIRRNYWGITMEPIGTINFNVDLGSYESPGNNVFDKNQNDPEHVYAFFNNSSQNVTAINNCWIEGQNPTPQEVENVIYHKIDYPGYLGEVLYTPYGCLDMNVLDSSKPNFYIYPNPTKRLFYLESAENGIVRIYDLNGTLIQTEKKTTSKKNIHFYHSSGVYIVEFESQKGKSTKKILVE